MTRLFALTTFSLTIAAATVFGAGCAHDRDRPQVTTITSGTAPTGVRVTNVPESTFDPAQRLASELCQREATCGRIDGSGTDEANLLAAQNCVTRTTPQVRQALDHWSCSATAARPQIEDCQAAIRSTRCETQLSSLEALPSCRESSVCDGGSTMP